MSTRITSPASEGTGSTTDGSVFIRSGFKWDVEPVYLFDIDGTLLRSQDGIHYNAFFSSVKTVMGHDLNLNGVVVHGNTDPGILRDAFQLAEMDDFGWQPLVEEILAEIRKTVMGQRDAIRVNTMPGVPATLEHLSRKGGVLGVATGNLESIGWLKIEAAGLRDWFRFGGFSDRYAVRSEMIGHAAQLGRAIAGTSASVCVVGDTPFDISAAQANSLPVIAVATGRYSFDELMKSGPDVCTTTLDVLLRHTLKSATEPV